MKNNVNIFDEFEKFDSEDFQTYQNRLLLRVLETILAEKGYLKAKDIDHAYAQCWVLEKLTAKSPLTATLQNRT